MEAIKALETYKEMSKIYDCFVGDFNGDLDFYIAHSERTDKIIEIGCGTGRVLEHFLKKNYQITGVDISPSMLELAVKKLEKWIIEDKLNLLNHNFTFSPLSEKFTKAFVTFYTYNYIEEPIDFLKNVYKSLSKGGVILLDLFYPQTMRYPENNDKWIDLIYHYEGVELKLRQNRKMVGNVEHRKQIFRIEGEELKINSKKIYYSFAEVKNHLESVGFRNIKFTHDYNLEGYNGSLDESGLEFNFVVKATK